MDNLNNYNNLISNITDKSVQIFIELYKSFFILKLDPSNKSFFPGTFNSFYYDNYYVSIFFSKILANDFKFFLPEFVLLLGALFILLYGIFQKYNTNYNYYVTLNSIWKTTILLIVLTIVLYIYNIPYTDHKIIVLYDTFLVDKLAYLSKMLILIGSLIYLLISYNYIRDYKFDFEFFVIFLFAILSMMLSISAYNFIVLFFSIETMSLCFYIMASFKRNSIFSIESGLKYYIFGSLTGGWLVFAMSFFYNFTGFVDYENIFLLLSNIHYVPGGILFGVIFLIGAFFFKLAVVPFHMWSLDVYEGASKAVTAFFMILSKIPIFVVLLRLFYGAFYDLIFEFKSFFILCAFLSIVVSSFFGLYQMKITRLIAYSSIGHIGLMLMGLISSTFYSIESVLFYLFIYIVTNINLFTIVLITRFNYITEFAGFGKKFPFLAFSFIFSLFSISGIPPLLGFFGKYQIMLVLFKSWVFIPVIVILLVQLFGVFYYIRLIKITFFEENRSKYLPYYNINISTSQSLILAISFLMIVFLFLAPEIVLKPLQETINSLLLF